MSSKILSKIAFSGHTQNHPHIWTPIYPRHPKKYLHSIRTYYSVQKQIQQQQDYLYNISRKINWPYL